MPLTAKGDKIMRAMKEKYGDKEGERIFYASKNKGTISGVDAADAGAGVLMTCGDKALFLKRSPEANDHQGEWCCPGGSVELGETAEQAAARETQEETGYPVGDLTQIDDGNGFVTFRFATEKEFVPDLNREHTEAVWAPMDSPPQPLHPGVGAVLRKLLEEAAAAGRAEAAAQTTAKELLSETVDGSADEYDPNQKRDNQGQWTAHSPRFGKKSEAFAKKREYESQGREAKVLRYSRTFTIPGRGGMGSSEEYEVQHRGKDAQDRREYDTNGWFEVFDNPLSKVGVFPYSEASLRRGGDPRKMINVYRPAAELGSDETVKSFRLMPWIDDHPSTLLGPQDKGLVPAEMKGVEGVIGEKTYFRDGVLYGNIKVFSEGLAKKLAGGKRELSLGYHCDFVPEVGVFEGERYEYVQRNLRGNHGATVRAGRMGSEVRVLDHAEPDIFSFALDLKDQGAIDASPKPGVTAMPTKALDGEVKDPEGKKEAPGKKGDLKTETADAMNAEEASDKAEEAKDAAEEKEDEGKDTKEARDRGRARDRRAGARDARKGARDAWRAKDAKDKEEEKKATDAKAAADAAKCPGCGQTGGHADDCSRAGKGMDAKEVQALVDKSVKAATDALVPTIRKEESAKLKLYGRLSPIVGAFDHAEMSHAQMAQYGLEKLGVKDAKADPVEALDMLLLGRGQVADAAQQQRGGGSAQDARTGDNFVTRYLKPAA